MDDILLIRNNVEFLESINGCLKSVFSKEDLDKAAYILGIKIYRDRSRRLMILSKEHTPWHDFEGVQNRSVKEGVLT